VADGVVVTIGPRCHVMCVDARSGDFKWGLDLVREFGTQVPMWYTGQCPLVENGVAVMAPGGSALLIGVDVQTGRVVWKTPNPHAWNMSHASVMPMEFAGRRAYVYAAIGGVAGVAADGNERGAVLWESAEWNHAVVSPSPVPLADGRILLTAGYGVGSRMMQVQQTNSGFAVRSLFPLDRQVFACEQHTPLFYQGHLFTVLPSDAGARKQQLVCMTPEGRVTWASGEAYRYGLGPFMIADGKLFMLDDNGKLSLLRASAERFERLAEAKVLSGVEAWAPLALVQGRLLARDRNRMVCLDVAAR
jgi:outer membrane protein assembly factor BamB